MLIIVLFISASAPPLPAQEIQHKPGDYFFELLPDGTPRFTQVLHWEADPNVFYYEVTLQTAAGEEISVSRTEEARFGFSLKPGDYRYRIVFYNLLRQPELELQWQEFSILKAEIPRIDRHGPNVWFLENRGPVVTVSGQDLIPGATIKLTREGGIDTTLNPVNNPAAGSSQTSAAPAHPSFQGSEVERTGTSTVTVKFPHQSLTPGIYTLEWVNPGGLTSTLTKALLVRHMLPPPEKLDPAPGVVFGPKELRGMDFLRFTWKEVPEATHYSFVLYDILVPGSMDAPFDGPSAGSGNGPIEGPIMEPLVREQLSAECSWTLEDLSLLDRGRFRWTVKAVAKNGAEVVIPAAKAAEADFTIDLPRIRVPEMKSGAVFYGR